MLHEVLWICWRHCCSYLASILLLVISALAELYIGSRRESSDNIAPYVINAQKQNWKQKSNSYQWSILMINYRYLGDFLQTAVYLLPVEYPVYHSGTNSRE